MSLTHLIIPATIALAAVGCASSALPVQQMTSPRQEIRAAEEIGAAQHPQGALHLKYAKDQVAEADKLLANGDEENAQLALMRATADAKLAVELAREDKARDEALEAQKKIAELRKKTMTSTSE